MKKNKKIVRCVLTFLGAVSILILIRNKMDCLRKEEEMKIKKEIEVEDDTMGMVYQPFQMSINPVKKLMLFNFEKNPDKIYKSLELQYWVVKEQEKGYVIIAYRNDEYVDVYAEETLKDAEFSQFEVCGKGLKNLTIESLGNPVFELTDKGIEASFQLKDISERVIQVSVKEDSKKKSRKIDMVAPVGASSENPAMLPVFAMYDFDLVRKSKSTVSIEIDGKKMIPDNFPVPIPKDYQMRYFMRYGYDCELVEFAPAGERILTSYNYEKKPLREEGLIANYKSMNGEIKLDSLSFENSKHNFEVKFLNAFPDIMRMKEGTREGKFQMVMDTSMGDITGKYTVQKEQEMVTIILEPSDGWTVKSKPIFNKILFYKKSIFREWPKSYRYTQKINMNTGESESKWERIEAEQ